MTYLIRLYLNNEGQETFDQHILHLTAKTREEAETRLWLFSDNYYSYDVYTRSNQLSNELKPVKPERD